MPSSSISCNVCAYFGTSGHKLLHVKVNRINDKDAIALLSSRSRLPVQVVFVLPAAYPVTMLNFNFAPMAVAVILVGSLLAWHLPRWGAKHYFTGPRVAAEIFSPYHTA